MKIKTKKFLTAVTALTLIAGAAPLQPVSNAIRNASITATAANPEPIIQDSELEWKIVNATMKNGATDTIWVEVVVSNAWGTDAATEGVRGVSAGFKYDTKNFTLTEIDSESKYGSLTSNKAEALLSITPTLDKDEGIIAKKGDAICYLGFTPKNANVPNGTYPITWDKDATRALLDPGSFGEKDTRPVKYAKLNLVDGAITVGNSTFALGDVDGNSIVDASDASAVLAAYAAVQTGGNTPLTADQVKAADVDSNDIVDASDASTILAYYAYKQTGGKESFTDFLKA